MVINLIQESNGTNPEATIPWLDNIKSIMKKTGFDLVEVGMSKLKGSVLHDINAATREGTLSYSQFFQLLIEHYLNIPYASDALNAYVHLMQGKHESIMQYISRAKVLLECIHILQKCVKFQVLAMTNLTLLEDYTPQMPTRGLHLNRTPGSQWRMLSKP